MQGTLFECIAYLTELVKDPASREKRFEVKEKRECRSLTQNAYYWVLLNKLARKLGLGDSEVHMNMLRDYGVCEVMAFSTRVPVADYFKYYDELYIDFIDGEEKRVLKVYKGSSRMDSAEFSRLIDGMRGECEQQGIDVATPEEIARMRFIEPERGEW